MSCAMQAGGVTDAEMFRTFNMGIGMVIIVDKADVGNVQQLEPTAIELGVVVAQEGVQLIS